MAEREQDYHRQHEDSAQNGAYEYMVTIALRERDVHHGVLHRNARYFGWFNLSN